MKKVRKYYFPLLKDFKKQLVFSPLLVFIYVLCETAQPMLMGTIVDDGVMKEDLQHILKTGGWMILLSAIGIVAAVSNLLCASKTATGFASNLRGAIFYKIQRFAFADIDKFSTASLITRITNDTTVLQQLIQRSMMLLYRAPLMMIIAFFFVIRTDVALAGIIAAAIPVLAIGIFLFMRKGYPLFIKLQEKLDELNRTVRENLINIKVVKSFVREDFEKKKFAKANEDYKDTALKAVNVIIMVIPFMQLVMNIIILLILWIGGIKNTEAGIEIGKLISMVNYSFQILMSLMMVSMTIMMFARASASSKRITEVLDTEPSITEKDKNSLSYHIIAQGTVVFQHVDFAYATEPDKMILRDINFSVSAGEHLTIIGPIGSGKSTLLQLIPRLYDVSAGAILIDGVDARDYPVKELRQSIGVVQQRTELFSGTILENLRWGNPDATEEQIRQAARIAEADQFVSLFPDQYNTLLGRNGVNLSGGQKQRLSIARALLKNPKILLLDSSTSAIDTDTERRIRQNLKTELQETTVILVTQRIQSILPDESVLALTEDGRLDPALTQNNSRFA
ncbi:ABC transporter ATP-binding protein/permease [Bacteroidales bacterium OttesenSCG-928-B11]|nr:ABC transporter ATP-binding protein/permease [Bacteroidales bacterium OttesenSCG-928-E04]MDL2312554.1 ABC transporter ATP-binding protein/permease [Bacteroidales bacterium OttesenSCG-928-B11]